MKKVLIVTYYWPPAGGPGVQRVLKFAKYLPEFGWQPIVLTVEKGEYQAYDETLVHEISSECLVYKTTSLEPNNLFKKFVGIDSDHSIPGAVLASETQSLKQKIAKYIRLNLFIPDAKIGWTPFAVHTGKHLLVRFSPDVIFSSSPPPTTHLIAKQLARTGRIPWVADFRDPWTEIHYYKEQPRFKLAHSVDKQCELKVLRNATEVTCISNLDVEQDFGKKISKEKCQVIPNGYDEADFQSIYFKNRRTSKFVLMHLGSIGVERNPSVMFRVIAQLYQEGVINETNFEIVFVGKVNKEIHETIKNLKIENLLTFKVYIPHKEALKTAETATVLLLLITQSAKNQRILPGKTFEYMRMRKPILALGPEEGEVQTIFESTNAGKVIDYNDASQIESYLRFLLHTWKSKASFQTASETKVKQYSRKNLTRELAKLFIKISHE